MTVTYNSTGAGATSATSPVSWSHTIASSGAQTVVLVAVSVSSLVNLGPFDNITITATYGGTDMTLFAWHETGIFLNGVIDVFGGGIAIFYLFNPPTGAKTVQVTASGFSMDGLSGNSVAYDGVIGFGGVARTSGSSASVTVPTVTDDRVVAVFSTGAAPSTPTGTQRFSVGASYVGTGDYVSLQDTTGNQQVTLGLSNWLITGIRAIGINLAGQVNLADRCASILAATRRHKREEDRIRRQRPLVRVWDGEYELQHLMSVEYKATWALISNDSGPARTELPFDSHVAQWIHDMEGRVDRGEGRNVHVTVDYCGARMGYRLDKASVEQRDDGDVALVCDWLHDYEETKWYTVWSNPFLPSGIQLPRAFIMAGPVTWLLKLALWLQIWREHNPLLTLPDDPLDLEAYLGILPDQSQWATVVKPISFIDALASGVVWGVLFSRWTNWHDAANVMLEDAELSVVCRRYLPGDPPPWPGADLRYGTNVIDIVDKSGVYVGTSHGGTIFDGLARTFAEFTEDFLDSTLDVAADVDYPQEYTWPWSRLTKKELPYVVFRQNDNSPIQTSEFIRSPAKGVQILVGGHSMPGVNEAISASIQAAGDILGSVAQIGSLGGTIDTLLQPLYEDTILAFFNAKNFIRAQESGWSRYFERFQEPAGKAYTIASLMVLRAGFWATRTVTSWKVSVSDGMPYLVGDNGVGHFFLDDRVGLVLQGDSRIHMDRCRKLELAWDEDNAPEWRITIGDERIWQDPAQRAWGKIESLVAGLHEIGVW